MLLGVFTQRSVRGSLVVVLIGLAHALSHEAATKQRLARANIRVVMISSHGVEPTRFRRP
jgi:hypothetical protein